MKDTEYAYCVARLRAKETKMLNKTQIIKLIDKGSFEEAVSELVSIGWAADSGTVREIINRQTEELWELLNECVPYKKELDALCITNDYFNIKAAVKCCFTQSNPDELYVRPTSLDLNKLTDSIKTHNFSKAGIRNAEVIEKAYNLACITENGQNVEILIDRYAVDLLCEYAKSKKNGLINEVCGFLCDIANIKIAIRINALNKSRDFAEEALGNCFNIDRKALLEHSLSDEERLFDYLDKTIYKDGISLYKNSPLKFEKWCDDCIIKLISSAKYTAFGFDPVCAFYFAKLNEIKCIRIVLTSLMLGIDGKDIRERIGLPYA